MLNEHVRICQMLLLEVDTAVIPHFKDEEIEAQRD
jgi:hypothetical protein